MSTNLNSKHLEQAYLQLFINHRDVYEPYCSRLFFYNQLIEEISHLKNEMKNLRSSNSYRIGKFLLKPFSFLKTHLF